MTDLPPRGSDKYDDLMDEARDGAAEIRHERGDCYEPHCSLCEAEAEAAATEYPKTWWAVAHERGMPEESDRDYTAADFDAVGIALINGCPTCGATVAPYNSYQIAPDNPYAYCAGCAGVER